MSKEDNHVRKQSQQRLEFTYFADELGHIVETHPTFDANGGVSRYLGPLKKPFMPKDIDTKEKEAMWHSYWDNVMGWWEGERANERREQWQ